MVKDWLEKNMIELLIGVAIVGILVAVVGGACACGDARTEYIECIEEYGESPAVCGAKTGYDYCARRR